MTVKRFTAPSAREALAKARQAFGDGTIILSNRPMGNGVEVVATAEDALNTLTPPKPAGAMAAPVARLSTPGKTATADSSVEEDTQQLAMSTLSFQDYVRERMLKRRHELRGNDGSAFERLHAGTPTPRDAGMATPAGTPRKLDRAFAAEQAPVERARESAALPAAPQKVLDELQAMRAYMEERFNTFNWLGQVQQDPLQVNLLLKLIRAGYSPALSRAIVSRMPDGMQAADAFRWLLDVLERNLRVETEQTGVVERGGVFSLVGATGVGKTSVATKLAALCAQRHGPASVGLITLDVQRAGAHEQLRAAAKTLGVVAHLAHDRAALQEMLNLLSNKRLVLIDSMGLAPRDPARNELLSLLDLPRVERVVVISASAQGDVIDESIGAFRSATDPHVILTKVDEAVKTGPALDGLIRHQAVLRGVSQGQRTVEDWLEARGADLVRQSMRAPVRSTFDVAAADLRFLFAEPPLSAPLRPRTETAVDNH